MNELKSQFWKVITVPKIKVILWKTLSNALHAAELVDARGLK